jgi:hypothetical protein
MEAVKPFKQCLADAAILEGSRAQIVISPESRAHWVDSIRAGVSTIAKHESRAEVLKATGDIADANGHGAVLFVGQTGMVLNILAAAIAGSDESFTRRVFCWPPIARNLVAIACQIDERAPTIAEMLRSQARDILNSLGMERSACHCSTCCAVAAVKRIENELDAVDGPTLSEWIDVVSRYREAVDALCATIKAIDTTPESQTTHPVSRN